MNSLTSCPQCGAPLADDAKVCGQCNAIQESFRYRSRMAAAALAFFSGWFGGHRFFLGQWWGVVYLLLFWTSIPGLVAWIEGVVFLATDQRSWNQKYNHGVNAGQEGGAAVLIIVALILPLIAVIGILAAIAIPAYVEFSHRAQVAQGFDAATPVKMAVTEYINTHDAMPATLEEAGLQPPLNEQLSSIDIRNGVITATLAVPDIDGAIIWTPSQTSEGVEWSCKESTIEPRQYLPSPCR